MQISIKQNSAEDLANHYNNFLVDNYFVNGKQLLGGLKKKRKDVVN